MAKFKLKFVLSGIDFGEDKFKLKFVACPSIAPRTIPPSAQLMDDLDGEARWSRAIQETFNRLDKAVLEVSCVALDQRASHTTPRGVRGRHPVRL